MSDRIVVMREGRFEQIGTPADVYDRPRTAFVARFVGSANIFRGIARRGDQGCCCLQTQGGCLPFLPGAAPLPEGAPLTLAVRSEHLRFQKGEPAPGTPGIRGTVTEKSFAGGMLRITFALPGGDEVVASRHGIDLDIHPGEAVTLSWEPQAAAIVEEETP